MSLPPGGFRFLDRPLDDGGALLVFVAGPRGPGTPNWLVFYPVRQPERRARMKAYPTGWCTLSDADLLGLYKSAVALEPPDPRPSRIDAEREAFAMLEERMAAMADLLDQARDEIRQRNSGGRAF